MYCTGAVTELSLLVPTIQDHAVCVRHWDWSETSQTVSLMTREHGMIRCLAKGSKRERSAFSGGLEIATMGHMVAIIKPSSELALLTAWDLIEPMYLIRQSLDRYHASMFVIDLVPRLINDHDPHPQVYDALIETLGAIAAPDDCADQQTLHARLAWYQWQLLEHTGARPELMSDVSTGEELNEDASVFGFSSTLGGLTNDPKAYAHQHAPSQTDLSDTWRVRRSTVDLMRQLRTGATPAVLYSVPQTQLVRLGGLLSSYIRSMIGAAVHSSGHFYRQV